MENIYTNDTNVLYQHFQKITVSNYLTNFGIFYTEKIYRGYSSIVRMVLGRFVGVTLRFDIFGDKFFFSLIVRRTIPEEPLYFLKNIHLI